MKSIRFLVRFLAGLIACPAIALHAVPLTLEDAIQTALRNNQRLKVSALSRDIAQANILAAYGILDPAFNIRRHSGRENPPPQLDPFLSQSLRTDSAQMSFDGLVPWGLAYSLHGSMENERGSLNHFTDNYSTFAGISVSQPILRGFGFGPTLAPIRVAKANRGISDWQHRQTIIDTITDTVITYNDLHQAGEDLRIARASRDLATGLLEGNIKRNEIGSLADAEVTQARARVANREEAILSAERDLRDSEYRLRSLLGETIADDRPLEIFPLAPATPLTVEAGDALKQAMDRRPDYQAALLGLTIQRTQVMVARNRLLPRLDVVGSYGYAGLDDDFAASHAQVRREENRAYSVGIVASIPLTFAGSRGELRAARLTLRRREEGLAQLRQEISLEVMQAIGQLSTTRQRVEATTRARELAEDALDAEQKRFKAGTSSTFLVLQLQEQLASVEKRQAAATADERRAIAEYERTVAITLTSHQVIVD